MIISVDYILIVILPVESPSAITVIGSFPKLWTSVDRCWVSNVDRRSSMMSILWLEMIIDFTIYGVEFGCNSLLVLWNCALLHEEICCSWLMNCSFYCIALEIAIICPTAN